MEDIRMEARDYFKSKMIKSVFSNMSKTMGKFSDDCDTEEERSAMINQFGRYTDDIVSELSKSIDQVFLK